MAQELYADPVGQTDIEITAENGTLERGVTYFDQFGYKLLSKKELDALPEGSVKTLVQKASKTYPWVESPETEGQPFITRYQISSEVGLHLFVNTLRRHQLA